MTTSDFIPFRITGINTAAVGSPTNDGSRGSGLYAVPFKLSRALTAFEQEALVDTWDNPPSYTNMHRPGIARCYVDEVVLAHTTIEEVRDYHMKTLQAVVEKVNALSQDQQRLEAQLEADEKAREEAHQQSVRDIANGLNSQM